MMSCYAAVYFVTLYNRLIKSFTKSKSLFDGLLYSAQKIDNRITLFWSFCDITQCKIRRDVINTRHKFNLSETLIGLLKLKATFLF